MGFFSSRKKSYLGVDIGSTHFKIVELFPDKGRARLFTYGYGSFGELFTEEKEDLPLFAEYGKHLLKMAHVQTRFAVTALPLYSVFSSIIHLPHLKERDLKEAVNWESKKVIPLPPEEMVLDWRVIGGQTKKKSREDDSLKILITGAPKKLIQKYIEVFRLLGLELLSLETEAFALIRSLIGNDTSHSMIIDFGGKTTNVLVVSDGIPVLHRSIEQGGRDLTAFFTKQTGLSYERAEAYKKDLQTPLTNEMKDHLGSIFDEIKYSITLYETQQKNKVEKIILTGGGASFIGLPEHISEMLGRKVYLGSPWARLVYPEDLTSTLDILGSSMSIAIGLSMREIFL